MLLEQAAGSPQEALCRTRLVSECEGAGAHIVSVLARKVRADSDDGELWTGRDASKVKLRLRIVPVHSVSTESCGIEGEVDPDGAPERAGGGGHDTCVIAAAHPLFDVEPTTLLDLFAQRRAEPDDAS